MFTIPVILFLSPPPPLIHSNNFSHYIYQNFTLYILPPSLIHITFPIIQIAQY